MQVLRFIHLFLSRMNKDCFEQIIQTNVMGVWYVTKAVANHMKNYSIKGSIIVQSWKILNGDAVPVAKRSCLLHFKSCK